MARARQYAAVLGGLAVATLVGVWGFHATGGGGYKYGQRFKKAILQGELSYREGPLVDPGRGVVFPEPVSVIGEVVPVTLGLLVVGVACYAYAARRTDDAGDAGRVDAR